MLKQLILVLGLLAALPCDGATAIGFVGVVTPEEPPPPVLLFDYDFEEAGTPSGITVNAGSPQFDDTDPVLADDESVSTAASESWQFDFTASNEVWIRFFYEASATTDTNSILTLQDSSGNELARINTIGAFNRWRLYSGLSNTFSDVDLHNENVPYWVWLHYIIGTGATSEAHLYWSETSTRPVSPNLSLTAQNETAQASRVLVHPVGGDRFNQDELQGSVEEL